MNKKNSRETWHEYFMSLANKASTRATCDRLHVGCVIVKDKNIISTGYNGSPANQPHCDDVGHVIEDNHCIATTHAEINAICAAAKHGHALQGSTIYLTHSPCWACTKALFSAGISTIIYETEYKLSPYLVNLYGWKNETLEGYYKHSISQ